MPLVNRASLGAEFFDLTSAVLLKEPEPQYLGAMLWKMSLAAALSVGGHIGLTPGRGVDPSGAPYKGAEEDRAIFEDPIYGSTIQVVPELGKAPGHTVRLNRPIFANTTYSFGSREIPSGSQISTTPINISSAQVPVTLKRFGGPYDQTNSRVAPYGVDRFDASMAVHSLAGAVGSQLQRDFDRTIDSFMWTLMLGASTTLRPTGFSADSAFSNAGGDGPMDFNLVSRVESAMDAANIGTFADGYRAMVCNPTQLQQLKDDPQFARYAEFHAPKNPLLAAGYYKSVGRMHLFKCTTLPTTTNGSSGTVNRAIAFAPGCIGSGIGDLPRTATSSVDNFGEEALVCWLLYAGFQLLDNRFVVLAHTN